MRNNKRVPVSVVIDADLLAKIDAVAEAQDMNRSQYLRQLARVALLKPISSVEPIKKDKVAA